MKNTILYSTSVEDLKEIIGEAINSKMDQIIKKTPPTTPRYVRRKEVADILDLSLVSVDKYTRQGVLKGYKIGGRILYKLSEIENSFEEIGNLKYRRK